ncbi:MAG: hypothetical protein FWE38_02640 [Firmicutes bacterium]|nr:hypothetical protein [Bacillota bacterium]
MKKKPMRVTVYGGTNNKAFTEQELDCSERLGRYLAKIGAEVLTGACRGFPRFVGREAARNGSKVIGYSPAMNEQEHIEKYKFPMDGVTHMEYIKVNGEHQADNFLRRSWDMVPFSDVAIALGGSWGTYTELLFSFWYKKTIILVQGFGGATEAFANTWNFFDSRDNNPAVHMGSTIINVANVDEAIAALEKLHSKL